MQRHICAPFESVGKFQVWYAESVPPPIWELECIMASRALKIEPKNSATSAPDNAVAVRVAETFTEDQIATRAYQLWQDRGCPIGSPEQDWLEAERQFRLVERSTAESIDEVLEDTDTIIGWQHRSLNILPWSCEASSLSLPHFYIRSRSKILSITEIEQGASIF
jgi:hypothetical protein